MNQSSSRRLASRLNADDRSIVRMPVRYQRIDAGKAFALSSFKLGYRLVGGGARNLRTWSSALAFKAIDQPPFR